MRVGAVFAAHVADGLGGRTAADGRTVGKRAVQADDTHTHSRAKEHMCKFCRLASLSCDCGCVRRLCVSVCAPHMRATHTHTHILVVLCASACQGTEMELYGDTHTHTLAHACGHAEIDQDRR